VTIRKTKQSDIPQIAKILLCAYQAVYSGKFSIEFLRESVTKQTEHWEKRKFNTNGSLHYVAIHENKVIAFIIGKTPEASSLEYYSANGYAELMSISILPEYQHKGLGKMLFEFIAKKFRKLGFSKMVVGTHKDNYQARKAYEKWGGILDTAYEKTSESLGHTFTEVFYIYEL